MQMTLQRENDVNLAFPFTSIKKPADFGKPRFEFFRLRGLKLYLPSRVRDLHGTTSGGAGNIPLFLYNPNTLDGYLRRPMH